MQTPDTARAPESAARPHTAFLRRRFHWQRLLLLIPFIAVLWVPFYNSAQPMLFSIPFFYWYQLVWVPLCAVVVYCVYRLEN
jgi:hypothetical protein